MVPVKSEVYCNVDVELDQGSATCTIKRAILSPFLSIKICLEPQNIFELHNKGTQL